MKVTIALTTFYIVLGNYNFFIRMIYPNISGICFEYLPDFIANQIIDRLHIQFGGQSLLHTVDDCEFSDALFRLFEQALRFIEETGILERHAHRVGKSLE